MSNQQLVSKENDHDLVQTSPSKENSMDLLNASDGFRQAEVNYRQKMVAFVVANMYPVCQSIYQTGVKYLQLAGMTFIEISAVRFFLAIFLSWGIMKFNNKSIMSDIRTRKDFMAVFWRNLAAITFYNLMIITTTYIPLSIMILIINTSGFWASLIGYYAFGDKLTFIEILGMIVAYSSIILIVVGGMHSGVEEEDRRTFQIGVILSVITSFASSAEMVLTRNVKHIHYSVVNMHYSILGFVAILAPLCVMFYQNDWKLFNYSPGLNGLLMLMSCVVTVAKLCYILANQLEKAGLVSVIFQLAVFYNFIADVFIFDYSFSLMQILGGVILLVVIFGLGFLRATNALK